MGNALDSCWMPSEFGRVYLTACHEKLTGVYFEGQKYFPVSVDQTVKNRGQSQVLATVVEQLREYFDGRRTAFQGLLAPEGTEFQQTVWKALLDVPFGQTATYGEIATMIGKPKSSRAVGAAIGKNPISVIIPCHRIVGTPGQLTGYAGGLAMKSRLLKLEGISLSEKQTIVDQIRNVRSQPNEHIV